MDSNGLSPYYFPTTVVFIDDDANFLENISGSMPDDIALRTFVQPRRALEHIEECSHDTPVPERCFVLPDMDETDVPVRLDLTSITETLYSEQRFAEVTVVVIDYDMPRMNGLEVCRELEGRPMKKILLTGKADESTAIRAFNAGLIDHFIAKGEKGINKLLEETIRRLQQSYFREVAAPIVPALGRFVSGFLSDPAFSHFFRAQMAEHGWVEFYLDPIARGLLCIDARGQSTLLLVGHQRQLEKAAQRLDRQGKSAELAALLRRGEVILNPYDDDGDWRTATKLAQAVAGSDWLVAEVHDPGHLKIQSERLFSYHYYLDILDYMANAAKGQ